MVVLPEHIGPATLFKVTVGNTLTFTVAVELKVVGPQLGLLAVTALFIAILCKVISVLVVNSEVHIVSVAPVPVLVLVEVPCK